MNYDSINKCVTTSSQVSPITYYKEQRFYVDDGCHSDDADGGPPDDFPSSYEMKTFQAGVRCCNINSDGNLDCATVGDCPGTRTYDQAVSDCQGLSGYDRLCTKTELLSNACCGSGGQCNHFQVWTSTSLTGNNRIISGVLTNLTI